LRSSCLHNETQGILFFKNMNEYLKLFEQHSVDEISKIKNVSIQYVYRVLKKHGVVVKKGFISDSEYVELFRTHTIKEIAEKQNVSIQYVYRILNRNQIPTK